jgi:hypothetical protein
LSGESDQGWLRVKSQDELREWKCVEENVDSHEVALVGLEIGEWLSYKK